MKKKFFTKKRLKKGATTMIEIVLILVVIVIACIGGFGLIANSMNDKTEQVKNILENPDQAIPQNSQS